MDVPARHGQLGQAIRSPQITVVHVEERGTMREVIVRTREHRCEIRQITNPKKYPSEVENV